MEDFSVMPSFSDWVLTDVDVAIIAGDDDVSIHIHRCSWVELCSIKRLWYPQGKKHPDVYVSFESWLEDVLKEQQLTEYWKGMLRDLKDLKA